MGLETNKVTYKKSWELVILNELCTRISDGVHFKPVYVDKGIPFISVKDVFNDKVHFDKCKYITLEAHNELIRRCFPEKDDVLITKSGTIGRMALVPEKPDFSLFVSVALIKNKKDLIASKFLKFCLENFLNHINISQDIKGGLLKNFHLEDIRKTLIPRLPLIEQLEIVSKIEELFSELDKGIEDLKTAQQQLKTYRQSVLKYAFEGKLTNEKVKDGVLPKGWKVAKMSDVIQLSSLKHKPEEVEDLFYVGLEHIEKNTGKLKSTVGIEKIKTVKNKFLKGDLLYGKLRPNLNKVYLSKEEGVCSTDILVLKLTENCLGKYLHQIMLSTTFVNEMAENTSGVNLPRVSTKFIMNYEIPLPTVEEQNLIILEIERRLSVADKMEESIMQSLLQAEALRQSILKKAFSGELV
jgi:type I restriction enzyme S subunit